MFLVLIITMVLVKQNVAVIYSINETEYNKMPALFAMDDYEECMLQRGGTYCVADYDLFSKGHSDLMHFIQEYSAYKIKHFNHTQIHRAVCVTTTCKDYLSGAQNKTEDIEEVLEACVNRSLWKSHELEARLSKIKYCKRADDETNFDLSDFIVTAVYLVIIIMNIIGSLYDIILCEKGSKTGNPYLLAFSIRRNWSKLIAPSGIGPDPRLNRLKAFNGIRAMSIIGVISSHTALLLSYTYIGNPLFMEKTYDDPSKQLIYNGSVITFTFFVMSGFLLTYNLQILSEKSEIPWTYIPKGILLRWLRLTPSYALIIATISTIMRHAGSGPMWDLVVVSESNYCRQYWWANILYFNNYMYETDLCFPQGWYLAADTQLFCVGLITMVLVQRPSYRKVVLLLLFVGSMAIVGGLTYFQDLDAVVLQTPESYRSFYINNKTFLRIYLGGHTNLSTYALGLAAGILVHRWQTNEKDLSKYKKYRWVIWMGVPLGVTIILSGGIFYIDGVAPPTFVKVVYASLYKPLFQALITLFIISCVFKIESVCRGIAEWRGFTWAARVSYSAFLIHSIFQRSLGGIQTAPLVFSHFFLLFMLCGSVFASFLFGIPLWILVESPFGGLTKALFTSRKKNV